ncbi:MAG: TolB-like protein [Colwellia sp.]|jgi:TolB-like protein
MSHYEKYPLERLGKLTAVGVLSIALTACSLIPEVAEVAEAEVVDPTTTMVALTLEDEIYSFHTHQKVNDYTDRLAHDLFRNMRNKKLNQPMVVTSFVRLDDTLQKTSKLGNLVSESLIGNIQEYDIQVMDIHLTGAVDITPTGDYVFSRNGDDIFYAGEISYVLSGVIVESERGYTINARIMDLKSKKIISTASTFIPSFVIEVI